MCHASNVRNSCSLSISDDIPQSHMWWIFEVLPILIEVSRAHHFSPFREISGSEIIPLLYMKFERFITLH